MTVQIVETSAQYIPSLRRCLDEVARERQFLLLTEAPTLEKVERFVVRMRELGNPQWVAVQSGEVVGWCDIRREEKAAFHHGGQLGMGIHRDFRGQGLGRRLLEACLAGAWAQGLRKVELSVFVHNESAIGFYRNCGFQDCGVTKEFAQVDGSFYDALRMVYFSPSLKEPQ